jgi:3'-phosphoadenosine 5'-phosphosulfate sulfotransferase (PAPS reductase)/FAD synthetase
MSKKSPYGNPYRLELPARISFSGGRTSGYLLYHIIEAFGGTLPPELLVTFANTGREVEETLEFVRDCEKHWGIKIHWIEYCRDESKPAVKPDCGQKRIGCHSFKEVTFETAARCGEPFRALIEVKADFRKEAKGEVPILPNPTDRWCSGELKQRTMDRFMKSLDIDEYVVVVGIRADESHRAESLYRNNTSKVTFVTPLVDMKVTQEDVQQFWKEQPFDLKLKHDPDFGTYEGNCDLCLASETEVVTSEGIKPIGELVGKTPELLVPKVVDGVASEVGHFVPSPVRSFGVQRLYKVVLSGKGKSSKTVHATADHRWFLHPHHKNEDAVKTVDLKNGDMLRNLKRCPIGKERGNSSRLGAMRGFVYGDGTTPYENRPGTLVVHEGKDEVFRPMFDAACGNGKFTVTPTGKGSWVYYGLPGYWKMERPDLKESRHYLMGWLSGYFAADGCVSEDGNCVLNSTNKENLYFVRSLCALLGVQCYPVRNQLRTVTLPGSGRTMESELFIVNINRHHLTEDFFWLAHHKDRIERSSDKQDRRYGWTVESVTPTDRVEEVFCATVEGVGAFGLSDGLMTGNCFLKAKKKMYRLLDERPEAFQWWADQEEFTGQTFRRDRAGYGEMLASRTSLPVCNTDDDGKDACLCTD